MHSLLKSVLPHFVNLKNKQNMKEKASINFHLNRQNVIDCAINEHFEVRQMIFCGIVKQACRGTVFLAFFHTFFKNQG